MSALVPSCDIDQDGEADVGALVEFCGANLLQGVPQWQDFLRPLGRCIKVDRLMLCLASSDKIPSLYAQLCLWVASSLEAKFPAPQVPNAAPASSPVKEITPEVSRSAYKISARLAKYVNVTRSFVEDSGNLSFLSISTDKSSVGGLPLQNSFLQVNGSPVVFAGLSQAVFGCVWRGGVIRVFWRCLGDSFSPFLRPVQVIVFSVSGFAMYCTVAL